MSSQKVTIKPQVKSDKKPDISVKRKADNNVGDSGNSKEVSYLGKSIDQQYKKRKMIEHVLAKPSIYAGSTITTTEAQWCCDEGNEENVISIYKDNVTFVPAILKLFDEIIVNAADHEKRLLDRIKKDPDAKIKPVRKIEVTTDEETGEISVCNDGEGLDVVMHPEYNQWVPQLIFSNLLTSANYDEAEEKTIGGQHGIGAKLVAILSKSFTIETVDWRRKLKFKQTYRNNLSEIGDPEIEKYTRVPFTKITYTPDYERFDIKNPAVIDDWKLIKRRVVDISACTGRNVLVYLNGSKLPTKEFEDYINLYIGNKRDTKRVFQKINDRWEVAVCLSPNGEFEQISFVNSINTDVGGRHVEHVLTKLINQIKKQVKESSKKKVDIQAKDIRKNLMIFVKSTIVNPDFDTQTKRKLTTKVEDFGSVCDIDEDFAANVVKLGVLTRAEKLAEFNAIQKFNKSTDANTKRQGRIKHPKLIDASILKGGASKRSGCTTQVLTEGDSAAAFMAKAIKGLPDSEHKYWGWFPLRGKLLNIRQATVKQLENNEEIIMIKKILGLQEGKQYKSVRELRYDRLVILSDNDNDGHHIKGLIMNLFSVRWPSLLQMDFIFDIAVPINRVYQSDKRNKISRSIDFFTESSFHKWISEHNDGKGWEKMYYKGLGTYEASDARDLFRNLRLTKYVWDPVTIKIKEKEENIAKYHFDLVFSKGNENLRKEWLMNDDQIVEFTPEAGKTTECSYTQFINNRLKLFSLADNIRSIPHIMDGLKPSQRKIMFAAFKRKLKKKIKVSQLAGYVSEHTSYHHGEDSLNSTIISMAQDYVGSGNINLLYPAGSFGTRMGGSEAGNFKKGDDASAPRYIYTYMSNACQKIFDAVDTPLLNHQVDEGVPIEPEFYLPVIPMILVNGSAGIGTGWSTEIHPYKVTDIIDNIHAYNSNQPLKELIPWHRGYNGTIIKLAKNKYITVGRWRRTGTDSIRIEELPVGCKNCMSFKRYVEFLNTLLDDEAAKKHIVTDKKKGGKKGAISVKKTTKKTKDPEDDLEASIKSTKFKEAVIKDYDIVKATDTELVIDIEFQEGLLNAHLNQNDDYKFEKKLKIAHAFSTMNMHMYDMNGKIKKYSDPNEIIREFCDVRSVYYEKRRQLLINTYKLDYEKASERYRFINDIMDNVIVINRRKKSDAEKLLENASPPYKKFAKNAKKDLVENLEQDSDESEATEVESIAKANYDYLLSMPMWNMTVEKLRQLEKEKDMLREKYEKLEQQTNIDLWNIDLDAFLQEWELTYKEWVEANELTIMAPRKTIDLKSKISIKKPPAPKVTISVSSKKQ